MAGSVFSTLNTADLAPLSLSQKKEVLLKHLDLPQDTYDLMAKETALVYSWLISEKLHLKDNCTRKAPYDWNDFKEQWKDDAAHRIARGGDQSTSRFWGLASQKVDPPNWIARWFLYHKFRHNDGRSRTRRISRAKHIRKMNHKSRGQEKLVPCGENAEETVNTGPKVYGDNDLA